MSPSKTGACLRVDLGTGRVEDFQIDDRWKRLFLDGAGLQARLLYDLAPPEVNPLSPRAPFILGGGPLTRVAFPGGGRLTATARSPLTGIFGDSSAGGELGLMLAAQGIERIVVEGRSDRPAYLVAAAGRISIEDASGLEGSSPAEAEELLSKRHGDGVALAAGLAGEKGVRFASLVCEGKRRSVFGRTGMGAVWGSKSLKALFVPRGALPRPADGSVLAALAAELRDRMQASARCKTRSRLGTMDIMAAYAAQDDLYHRNYQGRLEPRQAAGLLPQTLLEHQSGRSGCPGCPIACTVRYRVGEREARKLEFGHAFLLGPNLGNLTLSDLLPLVSLADETGLDAMELGCVLGFAAEAAEKGLARDLLGAVGPAFGDPASFLDLAQAISRGELPGLARGVRHAGAALATGAEQTVGERGKGTGAGFAFHVKGMGYRMDRNHGWMLAYAVASRGGDHLKAIPFTIFAPGRADVIEALFGIDASGEATNPSSPVGKGRIVHAHECFKAAADILGLCIFPVACLAVEGSFGWPDYARILEAAGDGAVSAREEDLRLAARRTRLIERAYNARLGIARSADRFVTRPGAPSAFIPLDHPGMLPEFYEVAGLDGEGRPRAGALNALGLEDVASDLAARGGLGGG